MPLGAAPREIYYDTITGEPETVAGVQSVTISKEWAALMFSVLFNTALKTSDTGATSVKNNTPLGIQITLRIIAGSKEQLNAANGD